MGPSSSLSRDPETRPGLPRTPNPDSATGGTADATISANLPRSRRTVQHDVGQVESATAGLRGPDFQFRNRLMTALLDLTGDLGLGHPFTD